MKHNKVGVGGFYLPQIYERDQSAVIDSLKKGDISYTDLSQWSFPDEFLCFMLNTKFFDFADGSYPNPRAKNEVPVWFLIAAQFILKLYNSTRYHELKYLLNSGSILAKLGFNVRAKAVNGFNQKNKKQRETAVDQDTIRKFFKDSSPTALRRWYNSDIQGWFKSRKIFDQKGLFVLDQTHLVVPKNKNYEDAVMMPVDEHGQLYKNLGHIDPKIKSTLYHPCYSLSYLLHINTSGEFYHVAGYEVGPGNEDELEQAKKLIPAFCKKNPGVMKELIVDRGYIDGTFLGKMKKDHGVDVLIPLKKSMDDFKDAFEIAERQSEWKITEKETDQKGKITKETKTSLVEKMNLWQECEIPLNVYVSKTKRWDDKKEDYEHYTWALAATKKYLSETAAVNRYSLRTSIEERNKQFKCYWNLSRFTSPASGLIETHVAFSMLVYSFLQFYLRRKDLKDLTHKTILTLKQEESLGKNAVIVYAGNNFGVLNLDDSFLIVADLEGESKQKFVSLLKKQKEARSR